VFGRRSVRRATCIGNRSIGTEPQPTAKTSPHFVLPENGQRAASLGSADREVSHPHACHRSQCRANLQFRFIAWVYSDLLPVLVPSGVGVRG
jgi:hypothetical protein